MVSEIVGNLEDRPWSTDVLKVDGDRVFISGGGRQGLKVGDHFTVETLGEVIKSGQSGLPITLPGRSIAEIEVVSFFGDTEYSEGSVAQVVSGSLEGESERLIVREVK